MSTKPDFPYYNGLPVDISPLGWLAVMASVVIAFALLIFLPFSTFPLIIIPAVLYTCVPLITLALVSGRKHTALFHRFGLKELGLAIGFGLLTMASSFVVGAILLQFVSMTPNSTGAALTSAGPLDYVAFLLRTFIQLIGEELMTILPLLAVLWLCVRKLGLSKRLGVVIAVVVSTALFAAAHLPTYNWNLLQCFGGIGSARLVLTAAYLLTRNLWVAAGAHIVNDWTEFLLPELLGALGHGPIDPTA